MDDNEKWETEIVALATKELTEVPGRVRIIANQASPGCNVRVERDREDGEREWAVLHVNALDARRPVRAEVPTAGVDPRIVGKGRKAASHLLRSDE